ncbi:MAG: efflux RND transporter periplasmic adaptor subunit, partial [Planctomycetota bacterium]
RIAASAQVAEAQATLAQEEAEADMARVDLERAGVADPGTLALREPQLARARATLASARAALEQAELDLERTRIRSPFDALVTAELVDVGQVVAPGTALFELVAIDAFEVRLPLMARDRALLEPLGVDDVEGPAIQLSLEGHPASPTWPGRIVRTLPTLDGFSRALVVIARVERPLEGALPLRIGEFVRATIPGRRIPAAVVLAEAAVRAGDEVWLASDDDRLERRAVQVAQRIDGNAIVESGLRAGDRVIVSALEAAPDGLALEVKEARP